jgi:S-adenosylmethionine:tRNA ribosyltransferase-isomerase
MLLVKPLWGALPPAKGPALWKPQFCAKMGQNSSLLVYENGYYNTWLQYRCPLFGAPHRLSPKLAPGGNVSHIYPNNLKNRILDEEKAPGFDRSKTGQFCNMGLFRSLKKREISPSSTTDSSGCQDIFSLESYDYEVPDELIARYPSERREEARLLLVDRKSGAIEEARVADLPEILTPSDLLVFNDTKVLHALLVGRLSSQRQVECLLCRKEKCRTWLVMVKQAHRLKIGDRIDFSNGVVGTVVGKSSEGFQAIEFSEELTPALLEQVGRVPLPPYMKRKAEEAFDAKRYQTVYAEKYGAVAAPTAGLHFSESVLEQFIARGIEKTFVTLHVGAGTFLPIRVDDIRLHKMHSEMYEVSSESAQKLNADVSKRRIAIGTTALRTLETVAMPSGEILPGTGVTDIYIQPGYVFKAVDALFTNFHTPKSSLLVLVSAFMGYDLMKEVYAKAIEKQFRLFSYGDAMLIM